MELLLPLILLAAALLCLGIAFYMRVLSKSPEPLRCQKGHLFRLGWPCCMTQYRQSHRSHQTCSFWNGSVARCRTYISSGHAARVSQRRVQITASSALLALGMPLESPKAAQSKETNPTQSTSDGRLLH
jgi:hypothetical protein